MTKAEIVQALYSKVGGFSRKESAELVDLVFEMMKETLGRGEKIKVSGLRILFCATSASAPGRNPQTGQPIKISERRVLTFKASQILKLALNLRAGEISNGATSAAPTSIVLGASTAGGDSTAGARISRYMSELGRGTLPPKLYFRIGEVADLVGVEPHVLRYWEREFRGVRPTKSAKGQRVYSRRDVENLIRVRELLYKEGFTIAGARKKLLRTEIADDDVSDVENSDRAPPVETSEAAKTREAASSQCVSTLRHSSPNPCPLRDLSLATAVVAVHVARFETMALTLAPRSDRTPALPMPRRRRSHLLLSLALTCACSVLNARPCPREGCCSSSLSCANDGLPIGVGGSATRNGCAGTEHP